MPQFDADIKMNIQDEIHKKKLDLAHEIRWRQNKC